tara:strand:+ start:297 stop:1385 length:1089 start_codon:yes stop_codon:yes gene_type:complete
MNSKKIKQKIAVIGGGVVGITTTLNLANLGFDVCLIDSSINKPINPSLPLNGSQASLGVLMGYIYRRSNGRGWRLRKRSMELWPQIINDINCKDKSLMIESPLIQLATSEQEKSIMERLIKEKNIYGLKSLKEDYSDTFNISNHGGIISHYDGRIDPNLLIKNLINKLIYLDIDIIKHKAICLTKKNIKDEKIWSISLSNGDIIDKTIIIICAALDSQSLLRPLGYNIALEPILGQAIEIDCISEKYFKKWPSVISLNGLNLIVKNNNSLIIGATLEPGLEPKSEYLKKMLRLNDFLPEWIAEAKIIKQWSGIRARPINKPSPIIESLEPGLILNTGHYRNGILLAPACAEWVGNEIKAGLK